MENVIADLARIRQALGTLQIQSHRANLDTLLGCMQLCDRAIDELRQAGESQEERNE